MGLKKLLMDILRIKPEEKTLTTQEENIPLVYFEDKILWITVGQWMNILPNTITTYGPGITISTSLSAEELMKERDISDSCLEEIEKRFGNLLKDIGINNEELCIFSEFNQENLSFKCSFYDAEDDATISLRYGNMDFMDQLIIEYNGCVKRYDFLPATDKRTEKLSLSSFSKKIDDNDLKLYRYISEYNYNCDIYDNNNRVFINISYPEMLKENEINPYIDEEKMEELLSSYKFPIKIDELCKKITEAFKIDCNSFPKISIKIKKMEGYNEKELTDEVLFKKGEFKKFVITKDQKTLSLDNFDNWSYVSSEYNVAKNQDNKISYGFKESSSENLFFMDCPAVHIAQAKTEIEEAKKLTKTIFQKTNN